MRSRCCVLLCALSSLAFADSTGDYFSKAFKRAMPSPFTVPQALSPPSLDLKAFQFEAPKVEMLPQSPAFTAGRDQCAIPLAVVPITKDRQFLIRSLPSEPASSMDRMAAAHTIPACKE